MLMGIVPYRQIVLMAIVMKKNAEEIILEVNAQ